MGFLPPGYYAPIPAAASSAVGNDRRELRTPTVPGEHGPRRYAASRGKRTVNSEPRPTSLAAPTVPPWASTIAFER